MSKPTARLIPLISAGVAPAATVTSALISPMAFGATGDLDPGYGDMGRLGPILNGPAWSIEPAEGGSTLLGGGDSFVPYYYYYYFYSYYTTNFVSLVSDAGQLDPALTSPTLENVQVFDIARQTDGQVVAVGRNVNPGSGWSELAAFRLQPDGALDTTFASDGIFLLPLPDFGTAQFGRSVVLDADGRIVIAGSGDDQVMVLRLLPNGSLDDSFGTGGVFLGPETFDFSDDGSGARTHILPGSGGGYRVTASNASGCQVLALTSDGALDAAFGTDGIATVEAPSGPTTYCNSLSADADSRLLVAGSASGQGFASRLLADGQPDPGFTAQAITDAMDEATAIAAGPGGTVLVAGRGVSGASIMRLQAGGELDAVFGDGGSTLIDLESATGTRTIVHDMRVGDDGSVLAAGGEHRARKAFVVRLLGNGGGDSPGVLGVTEQDAIATDEGSPEVVINVRRTGGSAGSVSVDYETSNIGFHSADPGEDYVHTTGTLTWDDGDTSEQQVHVPITASNLAETAEFFLLNLSNAAGGAGLGTTTATLVIEADGKPHGQFQFPDSRYIIAEGQQVQVAVARDYYDSGPVSVTLTTKSGSATAGDDFVASTVTLSWADGESGLKFATISSIDDSLAESTEAFTIELSDPAGGALIGSNSTTSVLIATNDQQLTRKRSGGGALGFLSFLLLGAMGMLRTVLARPRRYRRQA